jgi:hypothetical protein
MRLVVRSLFLFVMAAGCSSRRVEPADPPPERVAQQSAAQVYAPSLCIEWNQRRTVCEATDAIDRMYKRGMAEAGRDETFSAIGFEPPSGAAIASRDAINAWLDHSLKLHEYLRTTIAPADLVHGSQKRLSARIDILRGAQEASLKSGDSARAAIFKEAEDLVAEYVKHSKGFPLAVLQNTRAAQRALEPALQWTEARLKPLAKEMGDRLRQFAQMRGTEAATHAALKTLSTEASGATLANLPAVRVRLGAMRDAELALLHRHAIELAQTTAALRVLAADYESIKSRYDWAFLSLGDQGALERELAALVRSGHDAGAYYEARREAESAAFSRVMEGVLRRERALSQAAKIAASEETLQASRLASLSAQFLDEVSAQIQAVRTPQEKSKTLGLPMMYRKAEQNLAILDLAPMCQAPEGPLPWMRSGCDALAQELSKARTQLATGLPGAMRVGLIALKRAQAPAELLADVERALAAKKTREASMAFDAALHWTDRPAAVPGGGS